MSIRPYREWLPEVGPGAWIDPAATVIGRVTIGEDASIWPGAVVRGDVNRISIGARTSIQDGSVLHVASARLAGGDGIPLLVGEECTVGHGVILHACTIGRRVPGRHGRDRDGRRGHWRGVDHRRGRAGDGRERRCRRARSGPAARHGSGARSTRRKSRSSRIPRRTTSR